MREKKKDRYTEREIEGRERGERGEREGRAVHAPMFNLEDRDF